MSVWGAVRLLPDGRWHLDDDVPSGMVAYLDGSLEGPVGWSRCYIEDEHTDSRAAAELAATADSAAKTAAQVIRRMAGGSENGPAAVFGEGALAGLVRMARTGVVTSNGRERDLPPDAADPAVIVVATSSSTHLQNAIRRVARSGTVIVAARPAVPAPAVRTYGDIHARGLTIMAVPWVANPASARDELVTWSLTHLVDDIPELHSMMPGAWYRLRRRGVDDDGAGGLHSPS